MAATRKIAIDALQLAPRPAGVSRYTRELLWALSEISGDGAQLTVFVSKSALASLPAAGANLSYEVRPDESTWRRILRQQLTLPQAMRDRFDLVHYPDYLTPLLP